MAIADEDVARVRAATDLVALVAEHTALKRVGRRFSGLCPFHTERSPSFSVNAEEGLYHCFGCQASGDAITFVRAVDGCDFVEAVERLAARAGITLRTDDPTERVERGRRQALYSALAAAEAFYHERLLGHPDAGPARQYLRARGYDGATVRRFRLGFAPPGFDELARHLKLAPALLREAGLAHENARGRIQDSFRDRVMFPILDPGGRPIAFGGRILPEELRRAKGDPGPKYRNSPESPVYSKRRTLYGLSWAKRDIAEQGEVVVCEGYTDVIGFFSAGVPRAVATCGTALTEDHLRLLSRFAKRVVLAFDADRAGQSAAARLYEWERRHEVELAVAALPAGSDPAELALEDPAALARATAEAQPFLGFRVARALAEADLRTPEGRARAVESALAAVAEHPNELVRDQYLGIVADRTAHHPDALRPLLEAERHRPRDAPGRGEGRPGLAPSRGGPTGERAGRARGAPSRPGGPKEPSAPSAGTWTGAPGPQVGTGDEPPPYDDADADRYESGEAAQGEIPVHDRRLRAVPARGGGANPGRDALRRPPPTGREALLLAIHEPERIAHLFEEALFVDTVQRDAFRALGAAPELREAIALASPEAARLLLELAASEVPPEADPEEIFLRLVAQVAEVAHQQIAAQVRQAAEDDHKVHLELSHLSNWLGSQVKDLQDLGSEAGRAAAQDAAHALVAWLRDRQLQGSPGLEGQ